VYFIDINLLNTDTFLLNLLCTEMKYGTESVLFTAPEGHDTSQQMLFP
jgi:hypothetical protein